MRAIIVDDLSPGSADGAAWERLVSSSTESGIMQSLHWSAFKRAQGLEPLHIVLKNDADELVGGALFYAAKRSNGAGLLVAPEGPVLDWSDERCAGEGLRLIMDQAERYARGKGIMAMRIEPRIEGTPPRVLREFGRSPVDLVPRETLYLDLRQSEEQLRANMRPKGRYNIGLAQRHGVLVEEGSGETAVDTFHTLVSEASQRDDFPLESKRFFTLLEQTFRGTGLAHFLFAKHEEDVIGAMLLLTYGERATYLYGGISNQKRNVMGGYALQAEAIRIAKQAGCSTYDFYGFDQFHSSMHAYGRFSQFKRQFGGRAVRFVGGHDHFFLDCLADAFIRAVSELGVSNAR